MGAMEFMQGGDITAVWYTGKDITEEVGAEGRTRSSREE